MKGTLCAVGLGALCVTLGVSPAPAVTGALCIKNTLNGSLKMRAKGACRANEIQIGSFDGKTMQLSGINLQFVSGAGATIGEVKVMGILIVGYSEKEL